MRKYSALWVICESLYFLKSDFNDRLDALNYSQLRKISLHNIFLALDVLLLTNILEHQQKKNKVTRIRWYNITRMCGYPDIFILQESTQEKRRIKFTTNPSNKSINIREMRKEKETLQYLQSSQVQNCK